MKDVTLSREARRKLAAFVDSRPAGTPYRRRATIVLLADEGREPATIAPAVGLPARQVRVLFRAFKRQGMALFPRWVLQEGAPFAPDAEMAEAGRIALARQLAVIDAHDAALQAEAGATAVHETRKAIRRTRTLFKLLAPYFEKGAFRPYRRCLKKTMRLLGRARDLHVFLQELVAFQEGETLSVAEAEALLGLARVWQAKQAKANAAAREAAGRPDYRACLEAYRTFVETPGAGAAATEPLQVRHQAAVHVYRRLAALRAFKEGATDASVSDHHRLRILFKELRYTLEFFAPVMGREIEGVLADLNEIQDHLGAVNDARVALSLLAETEGEEAGVSLYRTAQEAKLERLVETFGPVWDAFDDVTWRRRLAAALVVL